MNLFKQISFKIITVDKNIVIVFFLMFVTIMYSCSNDISEVLNVDVNKEIPKTIAEDFKLVYTDSSRVKAILIGKRHEDYTHYEFKYDYFPQGIEVIFFDDYKRKSTIKANKAIIYRITDIVELVGDVEIKTFDNKVLTSDRLFWNQKNNWIFTEEKFSFTNPEDGTVMNGVGIDFSKDFSEVIAHKTNGIVSIKDDKNK